MSSYVYELYKTARNAAWQLLIDHHIAELPIDVLHLFKELGIICLTYESGQEFIREMHLESFIQQDGFSVVFGAQFFVFYDDKIQPKERIHFTLAHELGHIVLGHHVQRRLFCRYKHAGKKRGSIYRFSRKEMQANIFASRFLAPASVLHALHVHSAEEIAAICGLSRQAAQIRLERLRELEKRNKWILSPLEQQVIQQFTPFIERKSQMIPK